jgi:hypothetical protein
MMPPASRQQVPLRRTCFRCPLARPGGTHLQRPAEVPLPRSGPADVRAASVADLQRITHAGPRRLDRQRHGAITPAQQAAIDSRIRHGRAASQVHNGPTPAFIQESDPSCGNGQRHRAGNHKQGLFKACSLNHGDANSGLVIRRAGTIPSHCALETADLSLPGASKAAPHGMLANRPNWNCSSHRTHRSCNGQCVPRDRPGSDCRT